MFKSWVSRAVRTPLWHYLYIFRGRGLRIKTNKMDASLQFWPKLGQHISCWWEREIHFDRYFHVLSTSLSHSKKTFRAFRHQLSPRALKIYLWNLIFFQTGNSHCLFWGFYTFCHLNDIFFPFRSDSNLWNNPQKKFELKMFCGRHGWLKIVVTRPWNGITKNKHGCLF